MSTKDVQQISSADSVQWPRFSIARLSRWRWNVIDLVTICNAGAVPACLVCDIDMSWAEHYRARLRRQGQRVTVTALLIKAIAIAQLKYPDSRSLALPWGRVVTFNNIMAAFTVERFIDGQPVVYFGAIETPHLKSAVQITRELRDHADLEISAVRQMDLEHRFAKMPWLVRRSILWLANHFPALRLQCFGATFGITSLGKFGIKAVMAPSVGASTFGIGSVENRPVVRGHEVVIRPMMSVILTIDHRVIDGAPAARFLGDVRLLLEGGLDEFLDVPAEESNFSENAESVIKQEGLLAPVN